LQLAAYADALSEMGVAVAREAELQLGGDFYPATSGGRNLATGGYFFMVTDSPDGFSSSVIAAKSRRHSDSNSLRPNSVRSPLVAPGAAGHRRPVLSRTRPASRRADLKRGKPTLGPLRLPFWLS
jgi:hypothetical protein